MKYESHAYDLPFAELLKRVFTYGSISAKGILLLFVYCIKLILVLPATFFQYLFYSKKIQRTRITQPPVFILGHYRSGTTYLHKLMSGDDRFGFISYYDIICPNSSLLFGSWLKNILQFLINKLKIKTSFFNNTIPSLDEPAEEERFLINKGSAYTDYWRYVFPLCWNKCSPVAQQCIDEKYYHAWKKEYESLLKLAAFKNKGRQLLLKSPPNTERIKYLLQIFPDAKFIYISRNPYQVFYSTRNLWQKAIKKFCLQNISEKEIEEIIFSEYNHLTEKYEAGKMLIPAGNLVEINYEALEASPLTVLKKIYYSLSISGFETICSKLVLQLKKEKQYSKFKYEHDGPTLKKIKSRWAKHIYKWEQRNYGIAANEYTYTNFSLI